MIAHEIARRLGGRRSGNDWIASCPANDDGDPSLSLRDSNGKVLVHCHAGCTQQTVIEALKGLGLWPESHCRQQSQLVATYDYTDHKGALLYQVLRYHPKTFKQRYPDEVNGWIWRKSKFQVLYRLPEVVQAPIVFITEGEKDVETLRSHGFVATTNAGGARAAWLDSYTQTLRGRECIIIPDNDVPGWERAKVIGKALLGVASRIIVFDLPPGVKDIADWFEAGHSECELIAVLEAYHGV